MPCSNSVRLNLLRILKKEGATYIITRNKLKKNPSNHKNFIFSPIANDWSIANNRGPVVNTTKLLILCLSTVMLLGILLVATLYALYSYLDKQPQYELLVVNCLYATLENIPMDLGMVL